MSAVVQPTPLDRLYAPLRLLLQVEIPQFNYLGTYEYSVNSSNGQTVDASPVDTTIPLPSIANMPVMPSTMAEVVGGIKSGQLCLVQFVNGDPTRPEIVGFSEASQTVTLDASESISLGSPNTISVPLAGGGAPVARVGDEITVFMPATPVVVSGVLNGVLNFVGTIGPFPPATGIITGGNPKVLA
jgi:hypothetical protein